MIINKLIKDKKKTLITNFHVSGDEVYNIEDTYILKISDNIEQLKHEKEFNDLLIDKLPVCKSVAFEIIDNKAYYLKEYINGNHLCDDKYLKNPQRLIKILVKAVHMIHSIKNEKGETFVHGDLCLPNILVDESDEIIGIIDLAHSIFSNDLWIDYAWLIWSFEYNINSKDYTDELIKALNIKFDQEKFDAIIKLD